MWLQWPALFVNSWFRFKKFELFWCFWVVFRDFVFGYVRVFTRSRNLIFKSTRCLQIHYDRLGKDGLFSHKEVTVLFVPDFSECLPSLDAWRDQWAMACSQEGCCREGAPTFFEKWGLKLYCLKLSLLVLLMLRFIAKRHLIYTLAETNTKYVHAVMHICRCMDRYMFWDWVQIKFSRWKHCYSCILSAMLVVNSNKHIFE